MQMLNFIQPYVFNLHYSAAYTMALDPAHPIILYFNCEHIWGHEFLMWMWCVGYVITVLICYFELSE